MENELKVVEVLSDSAINMSELEDPKQKLKSGLLWIVLAIVLIGIVFERWYFFYRLQLKDSSDASIVQIQTKMQKVEINKSDK